MAGNYETYGEMMSRLGREEADREDARIKLGFELAERFVQAFEHKAEAEEKIAEALEKISNDFHNQSPTK